MSYTSFVFWGRGGEGVKTAAEILAKAAFLQGLEVQAFPEYGPERSGAPVRAFVKISKEKIKDQASITQADYVVVLDGSLLSQLDTKNLILNQKKAKLLINGKINPEIKNSVFIDASGIANKYLKKDLPGVVMLGALLKMTTCVKFANLEKAVKETLSKKPELLDGNLKALNEAYTQFK
ncbi:MAG: 2-oxoacid:acceptor oxidoreductase family protein [Candidatus ainarchaeum sp.]|nr:2-oxoacid:acceptor oxidoreductase family protein [Candidatus ainarchaeum sp.]